MERRSKTARSELLAVIVRQFSPSRIERELLTHALEVVVPGAVGSQRSSRSSPVIASESWTGSDEIEFSMTPR
jgi:hypothetical protein